MLALVLALGCSRAPGGAVHLEFAPEAANFQVVAKPLRQRPPRGLAVCPGLAGERRYGAIPHRTPEDRIGAEEHFLAFAAAYSGSALPTVLFDLDQDGSVECGERLPLLTDHRRPGQAFRTVTVARKSGEGAPAWPQRFRLNLPERLGGSDTYTVDLVEAPMARWTAPDGTRTLWLLHDGNFNGLYDRRFGDGFLVDLTGARKIRVDPRGGDFFSYHLPLALPWGTYELTDLDPQGRSATLRPLPDERRAEVTALNPGDRVGTLACDDIAGQPVRIGATGRRQLLFFWLSDCGSCAADAAALRRLLARLGSASPDAMGVSLDEHADTARAFVARHALAGPQCFAGTTLWDNALARRLGVTAPSSFVLLAPDGTILFQGTGVHRLAAALNEDTPGPADRGPAPGSG